MIAYAILLHFICDSQSCQELYLYLLKSTTGLFGRRTLKPQGQDAHKYHCVRTNSRLNRIASVAFVRGKNGRSTSSRWNNNGQPVRLGDDEARERHPESAGSAP